MLNNATLSDTYEIDTLLCKVIGLILKLKKLSVTDSFDLIAAMFKCIYYNFNKFICDDHIWPRQNKTNKYNKGNNCMLISIKT